MTLSLEQSAESKQAKDAGSVACASTRATEDAGMRRYQPFGGLIVSTGSTALRACCLRGRRK